MCTEPPSADAFSENQEFHPSRQTQKSFPSAHTGSMQITQSVQVQYRPLPSSSYRFLICSYPGVQGNNPRLFSYIPISLKCKFNLLKVFFRTGISGICNISNIFFYERIRFLTIICHCIIRYFQNDFFFLSGLKLNPDKIS